MDYELMELSTGNLVEAYPDEESALRDVRATCEAYGPESIETLALGHRVNGRVEIVAKAEALVDRARRILA